MSVELVTFVLNEITSHYDKPHWWDEAQRSVITQLRLESGKTIECGALMGVGPGWIVLNVLNAYCAWEASRDMSTFRVCGDDLIALWTPGECDRYEATLARLGLQSNKSKSFRSKEGGVFCERHMTLENGYLRGSFLIRLAEAAGAKALDGKRGADVYERLFEISKRRGLPRPLRHLASRSARIAVPRAKARGTLSQGGAGMSKPDLVSVASYAMYGPTNTTKVTDKHHDVEFRRQLANLPHDPEGIPARDVLVEWKTLRERDYRITNGVSAHSSLAKTRREIVREAYCRRAKTKVALKERSIYRLLADNDLFVRLDESTRTAVFHKIRHKAYGKAIALLQRTWDRPVSYQHADELISSRNISTNQYKLATLTPHEEWGFKPQQDH